MVDPDRGEFERMQLSVVSITDMMEGAPSVSCVELGFENFAIGALIRSWHRLVGAQVLQPIQSSQSQLSHRGQHGD